MKAIERVVDILDYLATVRSPCGVTQIGKVLGLSKSNVHRTLSSLESRQWVTQDAETGKYTLGSRVLELGLSSLSHLDLRSASLPYLNQLRDATNETAMLSLRVDLERMFIDQIQGGHEVRLVANLGRRIPLWHGASGKAMLAYLEESEITAAMENLRSSGVRVLASGQVVDADKLREELVEIRGQGFAVTVGERLLGATGVSAPIFSRDHRVVGSISVGGIVPRFTSDQATHCGALVYRAARRISLQLGGLADEAEMDR